MNVTILLAGLDNNSVCHELERIEHLICGLPGDTCFRVTQYGCERSLGEIQSWTCRLRPQIDDSRPELIIACSTEEAKYIAMSVAAKTGRKCHTDVLDLWQENGLLRVRRKVFSTHLNANFPAQGCVIVASPAGEKHGYISFGGQATVYSFQPSGHAARLIETVSLKPAEDLSKAKLVFLGGKGLGSRENFHRLEQLALKLGAACACTRPVALSGWADYDKVTGISGWRLQADVCIAFGVSGAAPLLYGLENVGRLIAVNSDKRAPIFERASDGVIADCLEIITDMENHTC